MFFIGHGVESLGQFLEVVSFAFLFKSGDDLLPVRSLYVKINTASLSVVLLTAEVLNQLKPLSQYLCGAIRDGREFGILDPLGQDHALGLEALLVIGVLEALLKDRFC